jgi:pSer/pThr/pTyr-binding forkhead associated (FHA) protein
MNKITINKGSFMLEELELQHGTIVIGRSSNSDIQLDDLSVSNHHAKIITLFNATFIQDLDSTNGTFVNGKTIRKHTLHSGDVVTIGRHQILFQGTQESNDSDGEDSTVVMDREGMETMIADYKKAIKSNVPINKQPVMNNSAETNRETKTPDFAQPIQPNSQKLQEQQSTATVAKTNLSNIAKINPTVKANRSDEIANAVMDKTVNKEKTPEINNDNAFIPKETQKIFNQDATQEVSKNKDQVKPANENSADVAMAKTVVKDNIARKKITPKKVSTVIDPSVNKTAPYFGPAGVEQRQSVSDETMLKLIIKRDSEYSPKKSLYSSIQTVLAFLALAIFGAIMYITFT